MKSLFGGLWVVDEQAGLRTEEGEQLHSFPGVAAGLGPAPGVVLGTEEPCQGGWLLSSRSRKTSNCSGSSSQGQSLGSPGPAEDGGGKGRRASS